jgi:hypothetical protein
VGSIILFIAWEAISLNGALATLNRMLHPTDCLTRWRAVTWGRSAQRARLRTRARMSPDTAVAADRVELLMWTSFFLGGLVCATIQAIRVA